MYSVLNNYFLRTYYIKTNKEKNSYTMITITTPVRKHPNYQSLPTINIEDKSTTNTGNDTNLPIGVPTAKDKYSLET